FLAQLELTIARIADRAISRHAEKTVAADRHIERIIRLADIALTEQLRHACHLGTDTGLITARTGQGACIDVRELNLRLFEADGIGIGHVMADGLQTLRSSAQAAQTLLKTHYISPGLIAAI